MKEESAPPCEGDVAFANVSFNKGGVALWLPVLPKEAWPLHLSPPVREVWPLLVSPC